MSDWAEAPQVHTSPPTVPEVKHLRWHFERDWLYADDCVLSDDES